LSAQEQQSWGSAGLTDDRARADAKRGRAEGCLLFSSMARWKTTMSGRSHRIGRQRIHEPLP
jgi:hypothetical protein